MWKISRLLGARVLGVCTLPRANARLELLWIRTVTDFLTNKMVHRMDFLNSYLVRQGDGSL